MKHIFSKSRKNRKARFSAIGMRLVLALLALMMIGSVLTSCGGNTATTTLTKGDYVYDKDDGHNLTPEMLGALADAIVETGSNGLVIREQLVAALNGYDLTVLDRTTKKEDLPEAHPEKAEEYVKKVISQKLKDSEGNEGEYVIKNAAIYDDVNVADAKTLLECFRTKVETKANMGFFALLQHWVALGFKWLIAYPGFGSFIVGTFYFAILVEILMLPLSIYQQKNSRKQAMLRPKEMAIRKKYAGRNDQVTQQKATQEVQEMYQKEGFSPMSGCLPLLVSFPVIIALYNIVINPMKYMMGVSDGVISALNSFATASPAAGGLGMTLSSNGTISLLSQLREEGMVDAVMEGLPNFAYYSNGGDIVNALQEPLSNIPNFSIFGVNFGLNPGWANPWLLFIPVVTFALYFFSTRLNRKLSFQATANDAATNTGCSKFTMDIMMPAMSAFFTFIVPGAVGMYWGFKSIVGMVKQVIISKVMPLPVFTEADFKAAEKELAAKEKHRPVKSGGPRNPNVRSLHYIDEDDDLEPLPQKPKGEYVEDEEPAAPQANGAYLGDATLKEDEPARQPKEKKKKKKAEAVAEAPATEEETAQAETPNEDNND